MVSSFKVVHLFIFIVEMFSCKPPGSVNNVRIGYETFVCLTITPITWGLSGTVIQIPAKLTADKFSSIRVKGSWTSPAYYNDTAMQRLGVSAVAGQGAAVAIESMGVASFQKAYRMAYSTDNRYVQTITFPLLLAIINVDKGLVTTIDWDDGCQFCGIGTCRPNTFTYDGVVQSNGQSCFVTDDSCAIKGMTNFTSTSLCQLNVYIVWSGTDSKGSYFESASRRFSQFSETQISAFASSLQNKKASNILGVIDKPK